MKNTAILCRSTIHDDILAMGYMRTSSDVLRREAVRMSREETQGLIRALQRIRTKNLTSARAMVRQYANLPKKMAIYTLPYINQAKHANHLILALRYP